MYISPRIISYPYQNSSAPFDIRLVVRAMNMKSNAGEYKTQNIFLAMSLDFVKFRKKWIDYYQKNNKSISVVCRRFDITRTTLYRWYNRYKRFGIEGLRYLLLKHQNPLEIKK